MRCDKVFDMFLQKEEYISASEFLRRREAGEISPLDVEIVAPSSQLPFGGFKVKLKEPRYRTVTSVERCYD